MSRLVLVSLWILFLLYSYIFVSVYAGEGLQFFSEDKLNKMFEAKSPEGDCSGGDLGGEFTKFKDISYNQCASYCSLNKDCKGFSYRSQNGQCDLKNISSCEDKTVGTARAKFYFKKIIN